MLAEIQDLSGGRSGFDVATLPGRIIEALKDEHMQRGEVADLLTRASHEHDQWGLPKNWLRLTAAALRTDDWNPLGEPFRRLEFLGESGDFLIIGPYSVTREGQTRVVLSGIYGSVIHHPALPELDEAVRRMFGELRQPITRILPIYCNNTAGAVGGEAGEAFVVPDGWMFPLSERGPAFNDMMEQRDRFVQGGATCIRRIFDKATADLLLEAYTTTEGQIQVQHQEYQFHEAGHAAGLGLTLKFMNGLLSTWWHGAVEEWRADGVAFEVAGRILGEAAAGRLIASNFCTRFGVDAHRLGGPERDRDVAASLLTMDQVLRTGALQIKKGKLALRRLSYTGLFEATALHRLNALQLTREEMALAYDIGIHGLYGRQAVEASSQLIFQGLVRDACSGVFTHLR